MNNALDQNVWDIIISDYSMPRFSGLTALSIAKERKLDIPFILISGTIGEEVAVQAMKEGASDYLIKGNIKRLIPAIERELKDAEERRMLKRAEEALQESELRFRTLAESAPVGIFTSDTKGLTTYVNPRWCEISKQSFDQALGNGWIQAVHPDDRGLVVQNWKRKARAKSNSNAEYRFVHPDGSIAWVIGHAVPQKNEEGCIVGYIGTIIDITDRKEMEADLISAKEKAEESDRLKSAFLANMSHEIRTPMNGILGFAELLKEPDLTGEQQQEYIEIIEKSGARMLNIINDIVDVSKIEAGQMSVTVAETSIGKMLEKLYLSFYPDAKNKGVDLRFTGIPSGLGETIRTDGEKLQAILTNLLKNAVKYTDEGSIEFGCNYGLQHPETLIFYVKDTGIGIPFERQQAIFDRFIQANIFDIQARQGAGLGLYIAKVYVEMLGGKIWVESTPNRGSVFYFTIPVAEV
jgi:PAS domain S-box-containing protein